jgi:hypothetical protein
LRTSGDRPAFESAPTDPGGSSFAKDGGGDAREVLGTPRTCADAAAARSYVGCDYWPTVVANGVWSVFDFAAVVANAGDTPAEVDVSGPGTHETVTVPPNGLRTIYLPWVAALKGPDTSACGTITAVSASVVARRSAYHLVSTLPVSVYQFNALEYAGKGGPPGKSWASCPGSAPCADPQSPFYGQTVGCFSFSNDASLLLPSTAMTGHYRVMGQHGWSVGPPAVPSAQHLMGGYVAITATQDGTTVTMNVASTGNVLAGGGIAATNGGGTVIVKLDAGDVAQLVTDRGRQFDLSGSLISADAPVQVLAGVPCINQPEDKAACDHIEEVVFPAETLGKHYVVAVPTGPNRQPVGHAVRLYGNVDGTTLTYAPAMPSGCPTALRAGEVADCGTVTQDFEVTASHEIGVGLFMLGGTVVDPKLPGDMTLSKGDPSASLATAVEQHRTKYVFLAPPDYDTSFVDVVAPTGTDIVLDGSKITKAPSAVTKGFGVFRIELGAGNDGAHVLDATKPVGIQVLGYGAYTSYQYPGGLDLKAIAPPPLAPK